VLRILIASSYANLMIIAKAVVVVGALIFGIGEVGVPALFACDCAAFDSGISFSSCTTTAGRTDVCLRAISFP